MVVSWVGSLGADGMGKMEAQPPDPSPVTPKNMGVNRKRRSPYRNIVLGIRCPYPWLKWSVVVRRWDHE